mgnify:CR=1 FL=1
MLAKRLDRTSIDLWRDFASNLNYIRVWRYLVKVGVHDFQISKIAHKTIDAIFIGHTHNRAAYISILTYGYGLGAIRESIDAEFFCAYISCENFYA